MILKALKERERDLVKEHGFLDRIVSNSQDRALIAEKVTQSLYERLQRFAGPENSYDLGISSPDMMRWTLEMVGYTFGLSPEKVAVMTKAYKLYQYFLGAGVKRNDKTCLLYTSPSPRDGLLSRMPSSA
eukprot:TRINITY_DN20766_c0_g1_i1.p3 TRINITY_DN20766_c0_g1~~TRINITY_DN20766_c0_g1_i1.p3  ORF type:complete len:129 (+),score=34.73 TRINITY_DN20766_c0_g1_i1:233-619(+)